MMELSSRPRRRERVLAQQSSDSAILLNVDEGTYFALNEVGQRIWELCDGSREVAEIAVAVHQEYEAPLEIIEADVLELLEALAREKLVVEAQTAAG